jgi:hypothetical protein
MKCKNCKKEFIRKSNSQKFCCITCMNRWRYWKKGGKEAQTIYRNKQNRSNKPAPNKIKCLICGNYYRKVGSHIAQIHGMTCREYREHFDLEVKKGLLKEIEREPLREHVFSNGTVNNLKAGKRFWFIKGDKKAGRYKRSPITLKRVSELGKNYQHRYKNHE